MDLLPSLQGMLQAQGQLLMQATLGTLQGLQGLQGMVARYRPRLLGLLLQL